ncbi:MAG TPA: 23S rRNA (adenine(2030)-N(6))-methyltransferase RlmJ [Pseudomonadales bacterium]
MLSYRHAFHAGNHADVLKHVILVELLTYLTRKPKAIWYVDTHAGAGIYPLDAGFATRNREYETGIARLWQTTEAPTVIERYLELIRPLNAEGSLKRYPGSPWLAAKVLRSQDRLWLHELHPTDRQALSGCFSDRRVRIHDQDGLTGLRALLPPATRRALVLIDPSYEVKSDYDKVVSALRDAVLRFPSGTYALWYPLLAGGQSETMVERLLTLDAPSWLDVRLTVRSDSAPGMYGSGMGGINPPFALPECLGETLPFLADRLGQDPTANHELRWEIP